MNNKPVRILEDAIIFDMFLWINKNYQWIILPEILKDICLRFHHGKKIIFIFRDGENAELSSAVLWIRQIVQEANITQDRVIIQTYNKIDAPFATLEQLDTKGVYATNRYPVAAFTPINNTEFTNKIAALFGRFSVYRLRAAKFIHDTMKDQALLTFKDNKLHILDQLNRFDLYKEEAAWVEKVFPFVSIDGIPSKEWPMNITHILYGFKKLQPQFFVDVTIETDVYNPMFITEKTTRNFFFGKPFVVFAAPGYLANIRKLGFKTFPELFDESYDMIENTEERFQAFLKCIEHINSMSIDQLKKVAIEMQPTFEYNKNLMIEQDKIRSDNILWTESYDSVIKETLNNSLIYSDKAV
jgi:hypothetical protein